LAAAKDGIENEKQRKFNPFKLTSKQTRTPMKKTKRYVTGMLATLALATFSMSGQAQTTNFMVYNFDTDQVSGVWANWFGGYFQSATWDSTVDAGSNPSSGSMQVNLNCSGSDQYVLWDNLTPGYSADMVTTFTNLSFDIRYDASSAVRTNAGTGDGSTGVGSLDYGYMQVGASKSWDQEWYYYFAVPATNGLGQPNTNWTHISIPINQQTVLNQYPQLATITDVLIGIDGANYGNSGLVGSQTYWVDNVQFIGPTEVIIPPPPVMGIKKATPALRLFGGSGGVYSRSQLTTVDQNQSWIGVPAYPVSYSFTLLNDSTDPGDLDTHIFFLPLNFFNGTGTANTHDMDYYVLNELWLRVRSGVGTSTCVADISWKTNAGFSNPNHTELQITNATAVGTWTLTFNSANSGTLTAPGASPVPFTISDPNVEANFGGPMILSFGIQNNGVSANAGVPTDWASISVSGVAGFNETNDFTKETGLDSAVWDTSNSNTRFSVVLVSTNTPYWITWTTPSSGYGLSVAPALTGPWKLPEFYNSYADGTNVPNQALQGTLNWALIPSSCLPTVDGTAGGAPSPNAFFLLSSPPPAQ
jgi:hypothetical protein